MSSLAELIGNHGSIIMGIERFDRLISKENFKLTKEHFTGERFFRCVLRTPSTHHFTSFTPEILICKKIR
jgi:hypothetical protein